MAALAIEDLYVDPEFEALLPAGSKVENEQLKLSVLDNDGFRDPIIYWANPPDEKPCIIDGYRRYRLWRECPDLGDITPPTKAMRFKDREAVKVWMIRNQISRRNVNTRDRDRFLRMMHDLEKEKPPEPPSKKNGGKEDEKSERQVDAQKSRKAADRVAKMAGVSASTVERAVARDKASAAIRNADPQFADQIDAGEIKLSHADQVILGKMKPAEVRQAAKRIRLNEDDWRPEKEPKTTQRRAATSSARSATNVWKPLQDAIGKAGRELTALEKQLKDEFPAIRKRLDECLGICDRQKAK